MAADGRPCVLLRMVRERGDRRRVQPLEPRPHQTLGPQDRSIALAGGARPARRHWRLVQKQRTPYVALRNALQLPHPSSSPAHDTVSAPVQGPCSQPTSLFTLGLSLSAVPPPFFSCSSALGARFMPLNHASGRLSDLDSELLSGAGAVLVQGPSGRCRPHGPAAPCPRRRDRGELVRAAARRPQRTWPPTPTPTPRCPARRSHARWLGWLMCAGPEPGPADPDDSGCGGRGGHSCTPLDPDPVCRCEQPP